MRNRDRERGDQGATLILVALVMVGLMGMAALVVDIGGTYSERRRDQSSADAGALAAAFALPDRTQAVSDAKSYAQDTAGRIFTSAQWDSCGSTPVPTGYTRVVGSSCIAFNGSGRRALVRIPGQSLATGFGRVLGFAGISHSAFAIAGVTPAGFGGVLPFGLVGTANSFICAQSGGGSTNECKSSGDGTSPGSFGVTNFAQWGDDITGTTTSCSDQSTVSKARIANNIAVGIDHDIEIRASSPQRIDTGSGSAGSCPGVVPSNSVLTLTGTDLGDEAGSGMWSGSGFSDLGGARLQRLGTLGNTPSWMLAAGRRTNIGGFALDNIPLWEFISASFTTGAVPRSCYRDQFTGADGDFGTSDDRGLLPSAVASAVGSSSAANRVVVLLDRCFTHYMGLSWAGAPTLGVTLGTADPPCDSQVNSGGTISPCATPHTSQYTSPVFGRNTTVDVPLDLYDIQYTPRFAFVPKTTEPVGASTPRDVTDFYTVYIQRVLGGCNAGSGGCGMAFDPGVGYSLPSPPSSVHGDTDAIGVMAFPHSAILPNGLALSDAAFRDRANRTRALVR